ncbi:MAG: chloride channel protein [Oscillospiraceae bacterium]
MKETLSWQLSKAITFLKWAVFSVLIGFVVGLVGVAFHYAIFYAGSTLKTYPALLYLLPAAGLLIVFLYRVCGVPQDRGTNLVLDAVRDNKALPLRTAPLIFISSALTHLFGGSAGREGAALQLGGSISAAIGHWMHLDEKDSRIITMCGMAAAFSALFGTPLAAAIFAMEVVSVGVMYYAAIVPCMASALLAHQVAIWCKVPQEGYVLRGAPEFGLLPMVQVAILGVLCALLAIVFCKLLHEVPKLGGRYLKNPYLRVAVGGIVVVLLTLLVGTRDYNGAGSAIIVQAVAGQAVPYAFLLKMLFTAVTLGVGYKGGEIVPVLFVGSTFGCTAAPLLGLSPSFGAGLGMMALFCGMTNCPMTTILLAFELFGGESLPLMGLCIAVSYMLSGYTGLYSAQKILYSKFKPEFINKNAD